MFKEAIPFRHRGTTRRQHKGKRHPLLYDVKAVGNIDFIG